MTTADVAAVAGMEQQFPSPWTTAQIKVELDRDTGISLVAETDKDESVVGWCCGLLLAPEAELLKIAVLPDCQRTGTATSLLHRFLEIAAAEGAEQIFLEVRASNVPALQLYRRFGWQEQGKRKHYYTNPADDAVVLFRSLKR